MKKENLKENEEKQVSYERLQIARRLENKI
jgi:hypothetical protein